MNATDIKRLIHSGETDEVEFKRGRGGVPGSFWESYSAFANTDGGVIVLGVKEENGVREIEGIDNVDKILAGVWNVANNHEKVSANVLDNALIHADYHGRRGIVIEKHYDTITFRNPGCMRLSRELAIAGGNSDARNTRIFNIFALIDVDGGMHM